MRRQGDKGVLAGISAILLLAAGAVHVSAAADHSGETVLVAGFLGVAALQLLFGAELLRQPPSRILIGAAVAVTVGSIGAWLLSRTVGLPLVPGGHKEPVGFKDAVCVLFEVVSVPALLLLLGSSAIARVRLGPHALSGVGAGTLALLVPAVMVAGHTHPASHALHASAHSGAHAQHASHARHTTHGGHAEHARHAQAHGAAGHAQHAGHAGHAGHPSAHQQHALIHGAGAHQHSAAAGGTLHEGHTPAHGEHNHASPTSHAHHHHHHSSSPPPRQPAATAAGHPAEPPPEENEDPVRVTDGPSVCVTDVCVP